MPGRSAHRRFPRIETERLVLTIPSPNIAAQQVRFLTQNQPYFAPWDPPFAPGWLTETYWRNRLGANRREFLSDVSARFSAFVRGTEEQGPVIAHVNFSQFQRGAIQRCLLGYRLDHAFWGKGIMREALAAAADFAFRDLGMHRIEANYRPTNERSGGLLRRLGFVVEGYARDYLFIDGAWRDHVLTALTNHAMPAPPPRTD